MQYSLKCKFFAFKWSRMVPKTSVRQTDCPGCMFLFAKWRSVACRLLNCIMQDICPILAKEMSVYYTINGELKLCNIGGAGSLLAVC